MDTDIKQIKKQHEVKILSLPDVVSVGIGLNSADKPVIIIGLEKSNQSTRTAIDDMLSGYPVAYEIIGPVRSH
ncbi:MAG: hypothetical protein HKM93_11340 [Desulfobacteraceae bacterium]|nr:hypothetical protein [Desulfobacteraceae bacterium]